MNFFMKPRLLVALGAVAAGLLVFQQIWMWEVERKEVPPGKFLVRVHKWGKDLPEGEILAPDESHKGVMLDVLKEGRHFLNPLVWDCEVHDMIEVKPGQCLVLTRLYGKDIPRERLARGDILARGEPGTEERGIVPEVTPPGSYRINPYAYAVQVVPAVEVRLDQVGVRTLKVGKDPTELPAGPGRSPYVVPAGYRGVQKDPVPPGTYYVNPYVETITPIEVRSHRVNLTDIQFPSRDGFALRPQVLVEYAVQPDMAPELLVRLSDKGQVHQEDATEQQQLANEVLQRIILPHIRGYARIEGSNFDARDFLITTPGVADQKAVNNREELQRRLLVKVKEPCRKFGIDIRAVTLADMKPPEELAQQISDRELARVEQEKNKVRLGQYKAEQKLKAAEALKAQADEKVDAETRLVKAKTKSEQRMEVEKLKLDQELTNAQTRLEAAKQQAQAVLARGQAEAAVITLKNEAEVAGLRKAAQGFGSAQQFAQYHLMERLSPSLTEIFASDESDFARLFSTYLTQPPGTPAAPGKPAPPVAAGTPAAAPAPLPAPAPAPALAPGTPPPGKVTAGK